ncbi:hypothetical protein [Parendozoicomonas haliclonae]|uniref:Uncharacterized protein n=1 Tax=Parendozoicomonas haliclonae TaxID=1960125 RepID=A0A1X7ARD4_9GAMM|nr:hypothetical protein [Parendozoicomonas haliclonae]SMA50881.1 hypothetical protein EHSB41UT_04699 [Parendozoicomonas haliclonae]
MKISAQGLLAGALAAFALPVAAISCLPKSVLRCTGIADGVQSYLHDWLGYGCKPNMEGKNIFQRSVKNVTHKGLAVTSGLIVITGALAICISAAIVKAVTGKEL